MNLCLLIDFISCNRSGAQKSDPDPDDEDQIRIDLNSDEDASPRRGGGGENRDLTESWIYEKEKRKIIADSVT